MLNKETPTQDFSGSHVSSSNQWPLRRDVECVYVGVHRAMVRQQEKGEEGGEKSDLEM